MKVEREREKEREGEGRGQTNNSALNAFFLSRETFLEAAFWPQTLTPECTKERN